MNLTGNNGTNGCNCGCVDCMENNDIPNQLVRTIRGVRMNTLYYEPDLFCKPILISPSLLIGQDEPIWDEHYNISHDEDLGTSGSDWKPLEEITVAINPKPRDTQIEGKKRMLLNSTHTYEIGKKEEYDKDNYFTYDWSLNGNATFSNNTTESLDSGKSVDITFLSTETITISVKISNTCGCFRVVTRDVYPGTLTKNLLIVRNSYF